MNANDCVLIFVVVALAVAILLLFAFALSRDSTTQNALETAPEGDSGAKEALRIEALRIPAKSKSRLVRDS